MHIPKEHRSKLDNKATPYIFVGYGDEEFGYRLWDIDKKKLVRSTDVVFHEQEPIVDCDKTEKHAHVIVDDKCSTSTIIPLRRATGDEGEQETKHGTYEPGIVTDQLDGDDTTQPEVVGVKQRELPE